MKTTPTRCELPKPYNNEQNLNFMLNQVRNHKWNSMWWKIKEAAVEKKSLCGHGFDLDFSNITFRSPCKKLGEKLAAYLIFLLALFTVALKMNRVLSTYSAIVNKIKCPCGYTSICWIHPHWCNCRESFFLFLPFVFVCFGAVFWWYKQNESLQRRPWKSRTYNLILWTEFKINKYHKNHQYPNSFQATMPPPQDN